MYKSHEKLKLSIKRLLGDHVDLCSPLPKGLSNFPYCVNHPTLQLQDPCNGPMWPDQYCTHIMRLQQWTGGLEQFDLFEYKCSQGTISPCIDFSLYFMKTVSLVYDLTLIHVRHTHTQCTANDWSYVHFMYSCSPHSAYKVVITKNITILLLFLLSFKCSLHD